MSNLNWFFSKFARFIFAPIIYLFSFLFFCSHTVYADTPSNRVGIVIMHGKGGVPEKHVNELAWSLHQKGYLVANLEMPWSWRRVYDTDVFGAETEVEAAVGQLKNKGASKVFVAGHSLGGLFAMHYGATHDVSGIIAIAPGGYVSSTVFRDKLGQSVSEARRLVTEGKGSEKHKFLDFEGGKGIYPVVVAPSAYLSWFDPEGAMTLSALQKIQADKPVLFVVPTNDYRELKNSRHRLFGMIQKNKYTQMIEPDADHLGAPSAAIEPITKWLQGVVSGS